MPLPLDGPPQVQIQQSSQQVKEPWWHIHSSPFRHHRRTPSRQHRHDHHPDVRTGKRQRTRWGIAADEGPVIAFVTSWVQKTSSPCSSSSRPTALFAFLFVPIVGFDVDFLHLLSCHFAFRRPSPPHRHRLPLHRRVFFDADFLYIGFDDYLSTSSSVSTSSSTSSTASSFFGGFCFQLPHLLGFHFVDQLL
jgi:hypothetical protein